MSTPTNALDFLFKERKPADNTPEPEEDGYESLMDYVQDITGLSENEIEEVTTKTRDAVMEAKGHPKKTLQAVLRLYNDADTDNERTMIAIEFGRVLAMLASSSKQMEETRGKIAEVMSRILESK